MNGNFKSLLDKFSTPRQLGWQEGPIDGSACIMLENYPLNIYYMEERGMLMFQGIVRLAPENEKERSALFARLLIMNNDFSGTGGACLGFAPQEDAITFQLARPLFNMNQERFDALAEDVVGTVAQLMQNVSQTPDSSDNVGNEEYSATPGMIRV